MNDHLSEHTCFKVASHKLILCSLNTNVGIKHLGGVVYMYHLLNSYCTNGGIYGRDS